MGRLVSPSVPASVHVGRCGATFGSVAMSRALVNLVEPQMSSTTKNTATVTYISVSGEKKVVEVPIGNSVMRAAIANGIDGIVAECGGSCMCATCHVYVEESFLDRLPPIAENEEEMLGSTFAERKPNSRLACQIKVKPELDGLIVHTPEAQN